MKRKIYVWYGLWKDNHAWAFYYFLKRMGDNPKLRVHKDTIDIWIYAP